MVKHNRTVKIKTATLLRVISCLNNDSMQLESSNIGRVRC